MMERLGLVCLAVVAALIVLAAVHSVWRWRRRRSETFEVVCRNCLGSGWMNRQERTFIFTGEGFADRHQSAVLCQMCEGTGRRVIDISPSAPSPRAWPFRKGWP